VKVLVTGGGGQLARAVVEGFVRHQPVAVPHAELDVCDLAALRRRLDAERPDLVLNAAAYTDVDGAEGDPAAAFAANSVGPRLLALATAERDIPIVHVSSDYVFDGEAGRPYHEFDAPAPCSTYGRSKLAGEEAVRTFNARHYVVRSAWLYAPAGRNFALTMRSLADRPEVRVVSDQFGSPTYAPHLATALERLIETGSYGTFHLAGQGVASWFELACALFRELGVETAVRPIPSSGMPRPARRPRFSALTTLQSPALLLPAWTEGVKAFAAAMRGGGSARARIRTGRPDPRPSS
jgi:dTDP-4-dehydrorhamnose reductase